MKCPYCSSTSDHVVDSRETKDGESVRRRRECLDCERRFTTYERPEEIVYMVVKKDGRRERFDPKKLHGGITKACEKRPVEARKMEAIVRDVEAMLTERTDREMKTTDIGNYVIDKLRELDKVAYVRFASVYKDFQDAEEFVREIQTQLKKNK